MLASLARGLPPGPSSERRQRKQALPIAYAVIGAGGEAYPSGSCTSSAKPSDCYCGSVRTARKHADSRRNASRLYTRHIHLPCAEGIQLVRQVPFYNRLLKAMAGCLTACALGCLKADRPEQVNPPAFRALRPRNMPRTRPQAAK